MIRICKPCLKEIEQLPLQIREELADAIARLELGLNLSLPLSRPMPSIGRAVHELRLRDDSGVYRVMYWIKESSDIFLLLAFKKSSQQTPLRIIELTRKRMKGIEL